MNLILKNLQNCEHFDSWWPSWRSTWTTGISRAEEAQSAHAVSHGDHNHIPPVRDLLPAVQVVVQEVRPHGASSEEAPSKDPNHNRQTSGHWLGSNKEKCVYHRLKDFPSEKKSFKGELPCLPWGTQMLR